MKSNSGFTLIELLVSMSIVAVVFLVGVSSFRDFSRRQVLQGVSKQLISDLRLIQQKALSGEKPNGCTSLSGYTFDIVSSNSYSLYAVCGSNVLIGTTSLSNEGVTISSTADPINFKVLGLGTNLSTTATITLTSTAISKTQTVTVGVGGDIK